MLSDLTKVAAAEEATKKSASKQRKKPKKKVAFEKPPSKYPLEPSLLPKGLSTEAGVEADDCTLVSNDQLIDTDPVAPESRIDV